MSGPAAGQEHFHTAGAICVGLSMLVFGAGGLLILAIAAGVIR